MSTDLTFTERTAALMRLPQARILPAALLELVKDMAAAHDANNVQINQNTQAIVNLCTEFSDLQDLL